MPHLLNYWVVVFVVILDLIVLMFKTRNWTTLFRCALWYSLRAWRWQYCAHKFIFI